MPTPPLVSLQSFGVAFGDRIVLADVSLELARTGLTNLAGPAGAGKSTLVRTLAGLNDPHPAFTTWGSATFAGGPLEVRRTATAGDVRPGVGMVVQHARFFLDTVRETLVSALPNRAALDATRQTGAIAHTLAQFNLERLTPRLGEPVANLSTPLQRRLAIVRALLADPLLLLADEPTTGLDDRDAIDVLAMLRGQAAVRSVVVILHNQRFMRAMGGDTVLLAGGRVQESAPTRRFFETPRSDAARSFVGTGGCTAASPNARPEDLDESAPAPPPLPPAALAARSRFDGPRGFCWVEPGRVGGLPRPGIVDEPERDLEGLRRLGVTILVTLEETRTVDPTLVARFGITPVHFPIPDMGAPDLDAAAAFCRDIARHVAEGGVVAMHCRAGLGRTGTMLACHLIAGGASAADAVGRVRRVNPRCIQSQDQVDFLSSFEESQRASGATAPDAQYVPTAVPNMRS